MTTPLPEPSGVQDTEYDHLSAVVGRLVYLMLKLLSWADFSADRLANPPHGPGNYDILEAARFFRVERALRWARALHDVFCGKLRLTPRSLHAKNPPRATPAEPTERRYPTPHPFGTSLATTREIFCTRSIREIAVRICCDLDLKPGTALWPVDVMQLSQTPAEWSAENYPPADPLEPPRKTLGSPPEPCQAAPLPPPPAAPPGTDPPWRPPPDTG